MPPALIVMDNLHLYMNRLPGPLNRRLPRGVIFPGTPENTQVIPVDQRGPRCPKQLFIAQFTSLVVAPSPHWDYPEKFEKSQSG